MVVKTALIFLILVGIQGFMAVIHSLKYFYTASSGIENFPSYVSVGFVDDVQISCCDSRTNENIPKQDWMNKVSSEHPNYWKEETQTCRVKQRIVKANLKIAKQRFNQTEGVHVFQQMYGCEWDDETEKVEGYDQFGYDGEDLITLDSWTQQWIALKPQAVSSKHKWDNDRDAVEHEKSYLTEICVEWLKKYVNYGKNVLMKTVLPSVSLLQRFSSSPVCCLATGFYPNRAEMFWRKDGKKINEGVGRGYILPNNDGTFQMSIYLDFSFVPPEDWMRYECVFQFTDVKENLATRLEKTKIMTNEDNSTLMLIVIIVAVTLIGFIAVTGYICCRKKTVHQDSNTSKSSLETSSLTSGRSVDTKGGSSSDKTLLKAKKNKKTNK